MLSVLRSKKSQFDVHDVTISLISCTNLKVSSEVAPTADKGVEDVKLFASFISNNEVVPHMIDGIAGNKLVISKPLMRHDAVDTTALWGNDRQACTAAQFSHNVPKKKSKSNDLLVLIGLMKGHESSPLAVTSLHIDTSMVDCILTLPLQDIAADPTQMKKPKPFSFKKRKTKKESHQPVLLNHLGLLSSAHGALLNLRVQVKGTEESKSNTDNNNCMVDSRHDVDTEEKASEHNRDGFRAVEQTEDDLRPVQEIVIDDCTEGETLLTFADFTARQVASQRQRSIMEKILSGFSCTNVLGYSVEPEEDESKPEPEPEQESAEESQRKAVDQNVESDLKEVVENMRNELELGHAVKHTESEDEAVDIDAYIFGPRSSSGSSADNKTVDIDAYMIGLGTVEEGSVPSRTGTCTDEEEHTAVSETKESCDDTFTACDNLTAYTEDQSSFMGGNIFL